MHLVLLFSLSQLNRPKDKAMTEVFKITAIASAVQCSMYGIYLQVLYFTYTTSIHTVRYCRPIRTVPW